MKAINVLVLCKHSTHKIHYYFVYTVVWHTVVVASHRFETS